jgi:tRNA(Arg) A34 adenosine deaminase TadA
MRAAIAEAHKGMKKGNRPFGSVIVKNGRIVARAHSTSSSSRDVTAHAELTAVKMLSKKSQDA